MSLLKSIHTLLGNSYRATDYNELLDKQESGAGYYTFDRSRGEGVFTLQYSLTDKDNTDPKMPEVYQVHNERYGNDKEYIPPVVVTAQTGHAVNAITDIDYGKRTGQMITTLPVHDFEGRIKGVMQFRASQRGTGQHGDILASRVALAQYVVDEMAPLLEPRRAPAVGVAYRELNSENGAIRFLGGMRDLWQKGIQLWSRETYNHTLNVTELAEQIARKIDGTTEGPLAGIKMPEREMQLFKLSAELHDLGKLYTPRSILESGVPVPGVRYELGPKETEIMNRHAQDVYDALDMPAFSFIKTVRDIASAHHIFADGSGGYPEAVRLKLLEEGGVPFEAKILAISDIFEALTAEREYREGMGLPLSTTLNIMTGMAKRGQIDAQVFRFCVEHSVFEDFAASKQHLSRYDPELYEKLAYSEGDMAMTQDMKKRITEETGIGSPMLDKLFKMSERRMLETVHEELKKPDHQRNPALPTDSQINQFLSYKKELNRELRKAHAGQDRSIDGAYVDKLLALTSAEVASLSKAKREIAQKVYKLEDGDSYIDAAVFKMEEIITLDASKKRGFYMGVIEPEIMPELNKETSAIKDILVERETHALRTAKEQILSSIAAAPLSEKERFTLFKPQRYNAPAAVGAQGRQ